MRIIDKEKLVNSIKNERTTNKVEHLSKESRVTTHDLRKEKDITFLTMESLILAQDERWRRASYMQVEREISFG